jgi:hypothetical protein
MRSRTKKVIKEEGNFESPNLENCMEGKLDTDNGNKTIIYGVQWIDQLKSIHSLGNVSILCSKGEKPNNDVKVVLMSSTVQLYRHCGRTVYGLERGQMCECGNVLVLEGNRFGNRMAG